MASQETKSKRSSAAPSLGSGITGKSVSISSTKKPMLRQSSFADTPKVPQKNAGTEKKKAATKQSRPVYRSEGKKGKQTKAATSAAPEKATYDKELTQKFDAMLDGDMTELPPLPKSMVRLFLSSTFSDMREERNTLVRSVYPELKQYCAAQDLEFQVVDMRWGVVEEMQNDHLVEKLCLQEVENCQKTSRGPNFVVLSGNRYGFRPIPTEIPVKEFETLRFEATKLKLEKRDLLDEWYKLDKNEIPPTYFLQPIRSKYTFFADFSPGCDEPRKKDTADWWKTYADLQQMLRRCADSAHKNAALSTARRHEYFLSVTECEIQAGILLADKVKETTLVFQRELLHLAGPALTDDQASRFIDTVSDASKIMQIDEKCRNLREDLIENKIPQKMKDSSSIKRYSVCWKPGGINPAVHKDHEMYLQKFCKDFISDCVGLIEKANIPRIQMSNYYTDYDETVHHLQFCKIKFQSFCGQEKVLQEAKKYILDESVRKPLVIHAPSGAGKTSIMAMIMKNIPNWLKGRSHVKLIRFLGTTPNTINIYDVLFSVVGQLSDASDNIMAPMSYRNMKNLVDFLPRHFRAISTSLKEPIIVLLDSIDQLSSAHRAYAVEWLPTMLPSNFKLILSTLPMEHGILTNLKNVLPDPSCYIEVPPLPETTGRQIVQTYMERQKRCLTDLQTNILLNVFKQAPTPLFLKLLLDEAKNWKSFTLPKDMSLPSTTKEAINALFFKLEKKFGNGLVSHALGYLTLGLNGLSEVELEDVLSCDDKVLNEVYKFHDPPVEGIVHIPPVLWARIHHDIKEYLVERVSYGKNTLNWYHRQFIETARERYTSQGKEKELHKTLAEIYLAENGVQRTITLSQRKNLVITDANRQVTPQPCSSHNRRKLACLPYHVIHAGSLITPEIAKSQVFCNFKFLSASIASFSVSHVVDIIAQYVEASKDTETALLQAYLSNTKEDLRSPIKFAVALLANIQEEGSHACLKTLLKEAEDFLISKEKPLLIPAFAGLAPRLDSSSAIKASVKGYADLLSWGCDSVLVVQKRKQVESESVSDAKADFAIFNSVTQDLQQISLPGSLRGISPKISWSGKVVYYVTDKGLVSLDTAAGKSETFDFSLMLPNWDEKQMAISGFETNRETTMGVAFFSNGNIACIKLADMTKVAGFSFGKMPVKISKALCTSSDIQPAIVVMGTIENASAEDVQGPENQSFISKFVLEQELPLKTIESSCVIDPKVSCFAADDETLVVGATEKGESKLLIVDMGNFVLMHTDALPIPQPVTFLKGNPMLPEAVVLTFEGKLFKVDTQKGQVVMEVEINNPITSFDILWDEQVALLGSGKGVATFYDLGKDRNLGAFPAHSASVQEICVLDDLGVTLGKNQELKAWSVKTLLAKMTKDKEETSTISSNSNSLLAQKYITSIGISSSGNEIITCNEEGFIKIWSNSAFELLRQYNIMMAATQLKVIGEDCVCLLDQTTGKLKILDPTVGRESISNLPKNVVTFTTDAQNLKVVAVCSPKKGKVVIEVINLQQGKVTKTIAIQKDLFFESLEAVLSMKEQIIVLKIEISDEEYNSIAAMWKKGGQFKEQPHRYRFTAVDIVQGTGGQMPCYRQLSKIPFLGEQVEAYRGNIMMITTCRWVVFWDIPTGTCDQRLTVTKVGVMYRPHWLGQDCMGTSLAIRQSQNNKFVAIGSEDGYMIIYGAESGLPRGNEKPESKHNAEVIKVAISPDSRWVASACRNCVLKMWDSETGKELFSFRVDAEVQSLMFSQTSDCLLMYTGSQTTRLLTFKVHSG